jgi:predicted transcriptional regulator
MSVMWRLEWATVEQVRSALSTRYCGAYMTVLTVLNRLAERGLFTRQRDRKSSDTERRAQKLITSRSRSRSAWMRRRPTRDRPRSHG